MTFLILAGLFQWLAGQQQQLRIQEEKQAWGEMFIFGHSEIECLRDIPEGMFRRGCSAGSRTRYEAVSHEN